MKLLLNLTLVALFSGCALQKNETPVTTRTERPVSHSVSKEVPDVQFGVVWELLSDEPMTLHFTNLDNKKNLNIILQSGLNVFPVTPAHWELTGYEQSGRLFKSMNISKKFVMRVKPKTLVYGGSILTGCPAIQSKDFEILKEMSFFNRYPFSSDQSICELVVGNDFSGVRSTLRNSRKNKKLNIVIGF